MISWFWMLAALPPGFILGWGLRPFLSKNADAQELTQFMDKIIVHEEVELQRNQTRRMLHDAKRRTLRFDGGLPAKVNRMRVRPASARRPKRHGN